MNKSRLIILPIFAVFFGLFFGWSTSGAQTAEKLTNQLRQVENLPSGTVFQLILTDDDATAAAGEYLEMYMYYIQNLVEHKTGVRLDFSDPKIEFDEDKMIVSIMSGYRMIKAKVSASADVVWENDRMKVNVHDVNVPLVSIEPSVVNSYIEGPINNFINDLMRGYEVLSFDVNDDYAILLARKR